MNKLSIGILFIAGLLFLLTSCGDNTESKLAKKWKLTDVESEVSIDKEIMGVDKVYLNLNSDKTYEGLYYAAEGKGFEEVSGEWFINEAGIDNGLADLFLEMGDGNEILLVTGLTANKMTIKLQNTKLIFEAE